MTKEEIKKKAEDWYKNTVKINEWNEKGVLTTYMPNATTGFIAGAKLIQKENTELEDTINKLREQLALRYSLEDKIKELEKENKEYESEAKECNIRLDEMTKKYVPRLVQAKEIIRHLVDELIPFLGSFNTEWTIKAEQFIGEENG